MPELNLSSSNLEAEIADLSKQIEAKKRSLEQQNGILPEAGKEMIAEVLAEHFVTQAPAAASIPTDSTIPATSVLAPRPIKPVQSYLDSLDPESVTAVNSYIAMVPAEGIKKTITRVLAESPFIIDAFHDALVTHLYDELKARGIIK
jgi:hypothetical protein